MAQVNQSFRYALIGLIYVATILDKRYLRFIRTLRLLVNNVPLRFFLSVAHFHFQKFGSKWRRACAVARKISKMAASFCKKMYGKEYILIICGRSKHIALGARMKTVTVKLNLCNHSNNDEL